MKSGNGIIRDEILMPTDQEYTVEYGMQFWLNLPAKTKKENPEYMAVQSEDVPIVKLKNDATLRVLIGTFNNKTSKIPTHSKSLLYHVMLNPGQSTSLNVDEGDELALALAKGKITVNDTDVEEPELIMFDKMGQEIFIENNSENTADALIFGGEVIAEKLVFGGPFVMNSQEEVTEAYKDFRIGKYGKITY